MARKAWEFYPIQKVEAWNGEGCLPGSLTLSWNDGYCIGIGPVPFEVHVGDMLGLYDTVGAYVGKLTIGENLVFDHTGD